MAAGSFLLVRGVSRLERWAPEPPTTGERALRRMPAMVAATKCGHRASPFPA